MPANYKTGKTPARPDAVALKFSSVFKRAALPKPPAIFGHGMHETLGQPWGVFLNDKVGDCVLAGAAHETMIWTNTVGERVTFTDFNVIEAYSSITGFDPTKPETDQGTDMQRAASWRRKVGILDNSGRRHTIGAYAEIKNNHDEIALACYLLGIVGVGLQLPLSAEDQFDQRMPWSLTSTNNVAGSFGGHYVPIVGRNSAGNFVCVTWGRLHAITPAFLDAYMDEAIAYFSPEVMKNKLSPEGYDSAYLMDAMKQLGVTLSSQKKEAAIMSSASPLTAEVNAAFKVLRQEANDSGYGWMIHDDKVMATATVVVKAVDAARTSASPAPAPKN